MTALMATGVQAPGHTSNSKPRRSGIGKRTLTRPLRGHPTGRTPGKSARRPRGHSLRSIPHTPCTPAAFQSNRESLETRGPLWFWRLAMWLATTPMQTGSNPMAARISVAITWLVCVSPLLSTTGGMGNGRIPAPADNHMR